MAALTTDQRTKVHRGLMRWLSKHPEIPIGSLKKNDLSTAIAETDQWIDDHAGNSSGDTIGYNGALSDPFKTDASIGLKTVVFCGVAAMRVSEQFARQLFGEVD